MAISGVHARPGHSHFQTVIDVFTHGGETAARPGIPEQTARMEPGIRGLTADAAPVDQLSAYIEGTSLLQADIAGIDQAGA